MRVGTILIQGTRCYRCQNISHKMSSINEFAGRTSLHGLQNATEENSKNIRKIIWVVILICSFTTCTILLTRTIKRYFLYESVSRHTQKLNKTLQFPAVTFCNKNQFKGEYFDGTAEQISQYSILFENKSSVYHTNTTVKKFWDSIAKNISYYQILKQYGYSLQETIIDCLINTGNPKSCHSYFTPSHTRYGLCFTFNSNEYVQHNGRIDIPVAGMSHGLQIILDSKVNTGTPVTMGTGFQVLIHDQSVFPFMEQRSFVVSPGKDTYVAIRKVINKMLSTPYSEQECFEQSSSEYEKYSQEKCIFDCMLDLQVRGSCDYFSDSADDWCSIYHIVQFGNLMDYTTGLQQCDECKPSCETINFEYIISSTEISPNYEPPVQNLTLSYIRENYTFMQIYYDTLEYSETEQKKAVTFDTVISDIGGLLGVTLGASVITLAEIVEYGLLTLSKLYLKLWNKNYLQTKVKHMQGRKIGDVTK